MCVCVCVCESVYPFLIPLSVYTLYECDLSFCGRSCLYAGCYSYYGNHLCVRVCVCVCAHARTHLTD